MGSGSSTAAPKQYAPRPPAYSSTTQPPSLTQGGEIIEPEKLSRSMAGKVVPNSEAADTDAASVAEQLRQAVKQAEVGAAKAKAAAAESKVRKDMPDAEEWSAASWLASMPLNEILATALLAPLGDAVRHDQQRSARELAFVRELGWSASHEAFMELLKRASFLERVADELWEQCKGIATAKAATAIELHSKFIDEGEERELSYDGLGAWYGGLEDRVGPPDPSVRQAMLREHCNAADSREYFTTSNYGIETTPKIEWHFVTDGTSGALETLGLEKWPCERKGALRVATPPTFFDVERQKRNRELHDLDSTPLNEDEFIAARIYTGPIYVKLNGVLRHAGRETDERFQRLCHGNRYTTTLHACNSAIVKLSKLTVATKVYRGVSGALLPSQFWTRDEYGVRGGVERAFLSTTRDREVALDYAAARSKAGREGSELIFEISMGAVDRGADLSWLSQCGCRCPSCTSAWPATHATLPHEHRYPHEQETLVGPMALLELVSTRVEGSVLVAEVRLCTNRAAITMEEAVGKLKHSHLQLLDMVTADLRASGAPKKATHLLDGLRLSNDAREPSWFNRPDNFRSVTLGLFDALEAALAALGRPDTWASDQAALSDTTQTRLTAGRELSERMHAAALLCARSGMHEQACSVLLQSLQLQPLSREAAEAVETAHREAGAACGMPIDVESPSRFSEGATKVRHLARAGGGFGGGGAVAGSPGADKRLLMQAAAELLISQGVVAERARLEVAHKLLTLGAMPPWPATLAVLAGGHERGKRTERELRALGALAAAKMAESPQHPPFVPTREVLVFDPGKKSLVTGKKGRQVWRLGEIQIVHDGSPPTFDVKWGGSELLKAKPQQEVLSIREGGEGGLLREAAAAGNATLVRVMLEAGVSPFLSTHRSSTALHRATEAGHAEVVRCLLRHGAHPQTPIFEDFTALELAVANKHRNVRRILDIHEGTSESYLDAPDEAAVPDAVASAAAGADTAAPSIEDLAPGAEALAAKQVTPLMLSCRHGDEAAVEALLEANAPIDAQSANGCTALSFAAEAGNAGAVAVMLRHGANVNAKSAKAVSPLMLACRYGEDSIVGLLLEAKAEVNAGVEEGLQTALHTAAGNGYADIMRMLIEGGAIVDAPRVSTGHTPLLLAANAGFEEATQVLIEAKANVEAETKKRKSTPLVLAARANHPGALRQLLKAKAEIDKRREEDGITALFDAAKYARVETTRTLLDLNASPNLADADGKTPLMLACEIGSREVVHLLLVNGAHVDMVRNGSGASAIHSAAAEGHLAIVRDLLAAGAAAGLQMRDGKTPMLLASQNGHAAIVRSLLHAEASPDAQLGDGLTALHLAAQFGHAPVIRILLATGAHPDVRMDKTHEFVTPLELALSNKHEAAVAVLQQALGPSRSSAGDQTERSRLQGSDGGGDGKVLQDATTKPVSDADSNERKSNAAQTDRARRWNNEEGFKGGDSIQINRLSVASLRESDGKRSASTSDRTSS